MFDNKMRVLLILPQDGLERARVLAGQMTTRFKLPVSRQIVLRALIEEGLRRADDRRLLANVERQAQAVRRLRSLVRRGARGTAQQGDERAGRPRAAEVRGRERHRR
jgi:hypothetical protein